MFRRVLSTFRVSRAKNPFETEGLKNYSISTQNREGILADVMKILNDNHVELIYIESELQNVNMKGKQRADFNCSAYGLEGELKNTIKTQLETLGCSFNDAPLFEMAWFPRNIEDLNAIGRELQLVHEEAGSDSQQFTDPEYRRRRDNIADLSVKHNIGEPIPIAEYSKEEEETWKYVYRKLKPLHKSAMCDRYNKWLDTMANKFNFA